jgi:hypothetical protein
MKKYLIQILTVLFIGILTIFGCKPDDDTGLDNTEKRIDTYDEFSGRITYHNEPVEAYDGSGKKATTNLTEFTYVANVTSPTIQGKRLSATGISIKGDKAYVSYHWNEGEADFAGAVEVIDIADPTQPTLLQGVYFSDTDLNELYVENNELYVVGGRSLSSSGYDPGFTSGGVVEVIDLAGGLPTSNAQEAPIPSYSGNSVFRDGDYLYCASGNTGGGVFEVSLSPSNYLQVTESDYYNNSKFGVMGGSYYTFLETGSSPNLHIHNGNNFDPSSKTVVPLASPTAPDDGKKVLSVDYPNQMAYVSSGSYGLHSYDLFTQSGTPVESFNTQGNGLLNGVDYDHNYVYAAKGSEGLYILDKDTLSKIMANFSFDGSANFVKSSVENVFIAHGKGGLRILAKDKETGAPDDPIDTEPCSTLLGNIADLFPERENAMNNHPNLFTGGSTKNVVLDQSSEVYVQFVWEGAGKTNTFGYFTYPANNPPTTMQDIQNLQKHVVFPNVTKVSDGGGLSQGDMAQLGNGAFPANTVIGFYLEVDGWSGGKMVSGSTTIYSLPQFNDNTEQQHLLFVENSCDDLTLTFEDLLLPHGDKDFNDIILVVKDNDQGLVNTKFDLTGVVHK